MEEIIPQKFESVRHETIQNRSREAQTNFWSAKYFKIQSIFTFRGKVKREDFESDENVLLPDESFQIFVLYDEA